MSWFAAACRAVVSPLRIRRLVILVTALGLLVPAQAFATSTSQDDIAFHDADGLTVKDADVVNDRRVDLTVTSDEVTGEQRVRVLLPAGYHDHPEKNFPVLYLLHGVITQSESWLNDGEAPAITADQPVITVIPDGGGDGWYTNWRNPRWLGKQNWETFHTEQLMPFIDANLHTIASRKGRAVIGLSMGGFGATHYAIDHPGLFSYVASFSGALDLLNSAVQSTIGSQELGLIPGSSPVGKGAIFGPAKPGEDEGWREARPAQHAGALRSTRVAIYTGSGKGEGTPIGQFIEGHVRETAYAMHDALDEEGIPHHFRDYGNGAGFGPYECDGNHTWPCWKNDFIDVLPRIMATVEHP